MFERDRRRAAQAATHDHRSAPVVEVPRLHARVVGKQTLVEKTAGHAKQPDIYQHTVDAVHRELSGLRTSALPAFIRALRRKDLAPIAKQLEVMRAAHRVQHMLLTAEKHVRDLEVSQWFSDPMVTWLRANVDVLFARARRIGVFRGAEHLVPQKQEPPKPQQRRSPPMPAPRSTANKPAPHVPAPKRPSETSPARRLARGTPSGGVPVRAATPVRVAAPVQRKAVSSPARADVATVASRGVAAASAPLPHAQTIQRAFGRHDISSIRVQIGGEAASASRALGAKAYATGSTIAFADDPDLHTAAHEAAHIIQQRAGRAPSTGLDTGSDEFEQHADRVADAVVRGESVESLLDELGQATPHTAVQRKLFSQPAAQKLAGPQDAATFFALHRLKIMASVRDRLQSIALPKPHDRLHWTHGSAGLARSIEAAVVAANGGYFQLHRVLPSLLHPDDPWTIIDRHRALTDGQAGDHIEGVSPRGATTWRPIVGEALAVAFEARLRESVARLTPRYVAQEEEQDGRVTPDAIVASHPFDRVVARLLCDPAVVQYKEPKRGSKRPKQGPARDFRDGLRLVSWEWQGDRDPKLWNWVRVDPPDATAEEVSASLFDTPDSVNRTEYAYGLVAAPPYFQVSARWAKQFAAARAHAPATDQSTDAATSLLELADSARATETAVNQGQMVARTQPGQTSDPHALAEALDISKSQLGLLGQYLIPWKMAWMVGPALRWATKYRDVVFGAVEATLRRWAPVIHAQRELLFEGSGELLEVLHAASRVQREPDGKEAKPFRDVISAFAVALGASHFPTSAAMQLGEARRLKATLPVVLLEQSVVESRRAAEEVQGLSRESRDSQESLERGVIEARARAADGTLSQTPELESLAVAAAETGFRNRVTALDGKLQQLKEAVWAADESGKQRLANVFSSSIRELPLQLARVQREAHAAVVRMDKAIMAATAAARPGRDGAYLTALNAARREALATAQRELMEVAKHERLDSIAARVHDAIVDARIRTLIVDIAALIGLTVATLGAGALVSGLVRGSVLAEAAVGTYAFARNAATAQRLGAAAGLMTDAALAAAGQTALMGGDTSLSFVENLLANAGALAALKPLRGVAARWGKLDAKAAGLWKAVGYGRVTLARGATVTAELLTQSAIGFVVTRAVHGKQPSNDEAAAWALQGSAMAVGRFVSGRLAGLEHRLGMLGEHSAHLLKRVKAQRILALRVERTGETGHALRLLDEHDALLQSEARLLANPDTLARLRLDPQQLEVLRRGNAAALGDTRTQAYVQVKLHFTGLTPASSNGKIWSGSAAQVRAAIAEAGGLDSVVSHDAAARRWQIRMAGHELTILETSVRSTKPSDATERVLPRHRVAEQLIEHQRFGARVQSAGRDGSGRRRYEVTYSDGERIRIVESAAPSTRPGADARVPMKEEAFEARMTADRAADIQIRRDQQLTSLILSSKEAVVADTVILGTGQSGTLAYATVRHAEGALPGVDVTSIPAVFNIAPEGSMFARHGSFPIGQKAPELRGPDYARQPGEFTERHDKPIPADDFTRSLSSTAFDSGMTTFKTTVTRVETRPGEGWGEGVPASAKNMPIRITAGGKLIYVRNFVSAGGLGKARPAGMAGTALVTNEPKLVAAGKLVYAQESLTLPGGANEVLVVGDGAAGAWACEAAIAKGAPRVYWVGQPAKPGEAIIPADTRRQLTSLGLTPEQIESYAKAYNARNAATFGYIKKGRIALRTSLTDAVIDAPTNQVVATLGDGTQVRVDGIVAATGQVLDVPAGMRDLKFRMVKVKYQGKDRVVALDAVDAAGRPLGIRVVGAQMAKAGELLDTEDRVIFGDLVRGQAGDASVPDDSRNVPGSIYQGNIDIDLAAKVPMGGDTE